MKKVWNYILLIVLVLILAVSVAMLMEHIVIGILEREEAREFELAIEAYHRQAEALPPLVLQTAYSSPPCQDDG